MVTLQCAARLYPVLPQLIRPVAINPFRYLIVLYIFAVVRGSLGPGEGPAKPGLAFDGNYFIKGWPGSGAGVMKGSFPFIGGLGARLSAH
ncbi:hypothetical protein AWJ19_30750 [Paenibacillus sp. DMB5]|nr:hypothetical protein AWJ19_30750 [Paenibacillus sp. DMB5]